MQPNIMFVKDGYATIVTAAGSKIVTTRLNRGRYVRIDDGQLYPQLCQGAARRGETLVYDNDQRLASDCDATLYKTRKDFVAAEAALVLARGEAH